MDSKRMKFADGICRGYAITERSNCYFVAQEYSPKNEDLLDALKLTLEEVRPIRANDVFETSQLICKISGLIRGTRFGIYELTRSQNRNVYLELGIAIGLRKPFILIKDQDATIAPLLEGIEYYPITSYLSVPHEFGNKLESFIANITTSNYPLVKLPKSQASKTFIISHGDRYIVDFTIRIALLASRLGLSPVILGDPNNELQEHLRRANITDFHILGTGGNFRLDDIIKHIRISQFGIYQIDKICSADSFAALGIAIGYNKPAILVREKGSDVPSDLCGLSTIDFAYFSDLERILSGKLKEFAKQ